MFAKLKMKFAAERVKKTRKTTRKKTTKNNKTVLDTVSKFASRTCRHIANGIRSLWNWVCNLNLVGVINSALLVAIIVLFSMLIIDVVRYQNQSVVVIAKPVQKTPQIQVLDEPAPNYVKSENMVTLPIRTDITANKKTERAVNVVPTDPHQVQIVKQQTAIHDNKFWGDVIIDSRGGGAMLKNGSQVIGNLYLQNMRKYTLPCGIRINGNLFLRDVNMLQFCGDFVITGNIYVSPRSSFGPIPKTATLGGYVVL